MPAPFDPAAHPRAGAGSATGGQFVVVDQGRQQSVGRAERARQRRDKRRRRGLALWMAGAPYDEAFVDFDPAKDRAWFAQMAYAEVQRRWGDTLTVRAGMNDQSVQQSILALARVKPGVIARVKALGVSVVVGNGGAGDEFPGLPDIQMPGHESDHATESSIHGIYFPEAPDGRGRVAYAGKTQQPGAFADYTILHEIGHGIAMSEDWLHAHPEATAAWDRQYARLDPYYQQGHSEGGFQEFMAESIGQYLMGDPAEFLFDEQWRRTLQGWLG